jgi:nitrogen-specific signal transduction histidine kinase/ActR/RegA family two-component response regulator
MQKENSSNLIIPFMGNVPQQYRLTSGKDISNTQKLIANVNLMRNYGILVFFINSIANYVQDLTYSLFITSVSCTILIFSYFFIKDKYFVIIRLIFILTICISISALCYVEGVIVGDYLYVFVLLIISIFIYDYKKTGQLVFVFLLIISSFVFIFSMAPFHSNLQRIGEETERMTFMANIFASIFITCMISLVILKQNYYNNKIIMQEQQFFNTVFNASSYAAFIIDGNTEVITYCNKQSLIMFDISDKSSMLGKNISILFKDFGSNEENTKLFLDKKQNWQGELTCCIASGLEFPGYVSIASFLDGDKLLKKISIFDITDLKKTQAELVIAKDKAEHAMKAKSQFLSNMSHELRTPLNGIIGTANLLLDEASMPEQKEHFDLLKFSSEHMLHLVNDVLDFSKIEAEMMALEKVPFNISEFLNKIQSLFASQYAKKNIAFEFDTDSRLDRYFLGDETRLSQVLSNLIANALKFTETGKVVVKAKMIKSTSQRASIYFSVKDTGLGITKKQQELIFLSFTQGDTTTTRKFGGTGLGLSISKNIIGLYNGEIQVESEKGKGSNFYFTIDLDLHLSNKSFVNEKVMSTLISLDNMKVLIAEDNQINMLVARKFLKKWNIVPDEAVNGIEALAKFEEKQFDVLLIDLEMPEMDGYQVIEEIRNRNSDIPVIAFTAAVYDDMQIDLISKGFTDYIQKPFRPEDLHRKLSHYASVKT